MHYPLFISKTLKTVSIATLSAGLLILSGCSEDQKESASEAMEEVQESTAEVVEASEETAAEPAEGEEGAWDKTKEASKETWEKTKEEAAEPPAEADAQTKQIEDR
jgi:hypothetical protein